MIFYDTPTAVRANRSAQPLSAPVAPRLAVAWTPRPSIPAKRGAWQTVFGTLMLVAVLAVCFGLSCHIYSNVAALGQDAIPEPLGDWSYGILP